MKKKFGWCFIGAGGISKKCAEEILKKDNCYIASIWNRTHQKAVEFAKKYHAKAYENVLDAINDENVEGVYIGLTNDQHYDYIKLCLENHKSVLCEKPFTMNEKEAKELFEIAKANNVYLAEAMWTWFNNPALKMKEWVENNKFGQIKEVTCRFAFIGVSKDYSVPRLIDINLLGGCLLDIGVYGLRYSLELFGYPKEIKCTGNKYQTGIDLNEHVTFIYDNFSIDHYFSITEELEEIYEIKGSKGYTKGKNFHATNELYLECDSGNELYKTDNLLYERQFHIASEEIRSGLLESKYVTREKSIKCMKIMDECRKQMGVIYPKEK